MTDFLTLNFAFVLSLAVTLSGPAHNYLNPDWRPMSFCGKRWDLGALRKDDWGVGQLMRRRAFLSGDWRAMGQDEAGLPSGRTLCERRGRSCRCQLGQVFGRESSSPSFRLPGSPTAGEGSRGRRSSRATRIAASVPPRAYPEGGAGWTRGSAPRGPGESILGRGRLVGG